MATLLEGIPHAPDARSWEAFDDQWPVPDGTEYLGRRLDDHEEAHSDDGWASPFTYKSDMKVLGNSDQFEGRMRVF